MSVLHLSVGHHGIELYHYVMLVQNAIYNADNTTALGVVRILMGWPLTGLVTILTVWMVRRANAAVEEAYPSESETTQEAIQEKVDD